MTKNKPWKGNGTSNGIDSQSGLAQIDPQPVSEELFRMTDNDKEDKVTEHQSCSDHTTTNYQPPAVKDAADDEILHVYQPTDEQIKEEASTSRTTEQKSTRNTPQAIGEPDVLSTIGNMLGSSSRSNPFGFLDVIGGAISQTFMKDTREVFKSEERLSEQDNIEVSRTSAEQDNTEVSKRSTEQDTNQPQPQTTNGQSPRFHLPPRRVMHTPVRRGQILGNYHLSSSNVSLEEQRYLIAECRDRQGVAHQSKIDLDDCLTNNDGQFAWKKSGFFSASARNVTLDGENLKAQLRSRDGRWLDSTICLHEKISNDNGQLILLS